MYREAYVRESENFFLSCIAVENSLNTVEYNKPLDAGFAILDLAKLEMYKFHNGITKNIGHVDLCYTDTD